MRGSLNPPVPLSAEEVVRLGLADPDLPGVLRRRGEVPSPSGYAVFDCETTGVDPETDEIVSFALVVLDSEAEVRELGSLVRPSGPIPPGATAVHGIRDEDVASAPAFTELAGSLLELLASRVFVAHNASFDLAMLQNAIRRAGVEYQPAGVACTLVAFRLLEPLNDSHTLESICGRYGVNLDDAHNATCDVYAAAALTQLLLALDIAPESAQLDLAAFMRLRSRGDHRPASGGQIRRVFALARVAGLTDAEGHTDRAKVCELVHRVAGVAEPDLLSREAVQLVYDELERLIAALPHQAAA